MKIYAVDCSILKDETFFAECFKQMPENRKKAINQYKAPEDRRRSLGARMLLNSVLAENCPEVPLPPEIDFKEDGKPFLSVLTTFISIYPIPVLMPCVLLTKPRSGLTSS